MMRLSRFSEKVSRRVNYGRPNDGVFVNESVNNEIPEKKVCLGVYTPTHTFFRANPFPG